MSITICPKYECDEHSEKQQIENYMDNLLDTNLFIRLVMTIL